MYKVDCFQTTTMYSGPCQGGEVWKGLGTDHLQPSALFELAAVINNKQIEYLLPTDQLCVINGNFNLILQSDHTVSHYLIFNGCFTNKGCFSADTRAIDSRAYCMASQRMSDNAPQARRQNLKRVVQICVCGACVKNLNYTMNIL